jgi:two-component system sensor histidine kinase HydH
MSHHLAALGEMAAGVAHEVRNPLNSIRGFSQLISERCADASLADYARIIIEEVDRMNRIVQDLLDFSRQKELTMTALRVNQLVEDVLAEFEPEFKAANVRVLGELAPGLKRVLGNSAKLKQVLVNIIRNAVQAMPKGGVLKVSTLAVPGRTEGEELAVRIEDNGVGIDPKIMAKIFNPFFTFGKEKGTGLGLAICRKIIEQHGGRIEVESQLGAGSVFTVFLPYGQADEEEKDEKGQ